MGLPAPNLDDRHFQDLVDDAKRYVQRACPEWTDHNVSDPGVTLIETFAQMVDQLIYRLNRVPDRHYVKFLELIGVRLFPPTAARGVVTFWLSAPQPVPVVIRAETEVATVRTDVQDAVVFSTSTDLTIIPCAMSRLATGTAGTEPIDQTAALQAGHQVPCFGDRPAVGDSLLVGLSAAVPSCAVLLRFDCPVGGVGIDPTQPPLEWEAWNGTGWTPCEVDRDETRGLNKPGDLVLHVPSTHQESLVARHRAGWLRCRVTDGTPPYTATPRLAALQACTIGGTAPIVHAEAVHHEVLGTADGAPGGRFRLQRVPVVPWHEPDALEVGEGDTWTQWLPVADFSGSRPTDRHYRLDPISGEIEFGPAVRQPDGTLRQYAAVPPKGSLLRMSTYRTGGGRAGNVAVGQIRVLKTSVPYVNAVENRRPATGGADGESLDNAKVRGPLELRSSGRAVTADDFEELSRAIAPDAARLHCIPVTAAGAAIRLLVVPRVPADALGGLAYEDLHRPPDELLARIAEHLDRRRLVGTRLVVEPPRYQAVTVVTRLTAAEGRAPDEVREQALRSLYGYLSAIEGGPDGAGWPLGRPVQGFDLSSVLGRVPGVAAIDELLFFPANPVTGRREEPVARIDLPPDTLVFSYRHQVRVQ